MKTIHVVGIKRTRFKVAEALQPYVQNRVNCSEDAAHIATALTMDMDRECFLAIHLNAQNRVIGTERVSVGTANGALVHPREVFRAAILNGACAIIIAHNHPSGISDPSAEDRALTTRLIAAGDLLGIKVLDHVIVTDDPAEFYSFADLGGV